MSTETIALVGGASDVLFRAARHIDAPFNASLPEAIRMATRNPALAQQAAQRLADKLRLHPRDLPMWDVTRPRVQVAVVVRFAARGGDA